jgi:hypothetical protein
MASITINDLAHSSALDRKAMLSVRGAGGAAWAIGAFRPFAASAPNMVPVVNYFEITNNYTHVDQMVNQFTTVNIDNSGANSNINAVLLSSLNN